MASLAIPILFAASFVSAQGTYQLPYSSLPIEPCPEAAHVIAAGGTGGGDFDAGLLSQTRDSVVGAIPGSSSVVMPYPHAAAGPEGVAVGTSNLVAYLPQFTNNCPNTPVILLGYSAGAVITMNAMCGSADVSQVIGAIAFGEQRRVAGQPFDLGTCTAGSGKSPRPDSSACVAEDIQSYCNVEDPECCSGPDPNAHFVYADQYTGQATDFLVGKYQEFQASGPSQPEPQPSSTQAPPPPQQTSQTPQPTQPGNPVLTPDQPEQPEQPQPEPEQPQPEPEQPEQPEPEQPQQPQQPPAPTSAPAAPAPAPSAVPEPAPAPAPSPAPPTSGSCPADLRGDYEYPHLIVPVSKSQPSLAQGTSYDGQMDADTSSVFNFDIPYDAGSQTCSLLFMLPQPEQLSYSSYTTSGSGGLKASRLNAPANAGTSYANLPAVNEELGAFSIAPGESKVISSFPCPAGERVGVLLESMGDYELEYFQTRGYDAAPIGLYVRKC